MKHIKEYISVNERISSIDDYIIEEGIKDKIKSLINKFKKTKVPEKVYTQADLDEYKDKEITEDDAKEIAKILIKVDKHFRNSDFNIRSCAQGILDYAWQEYHKEQKDLIFSYDKWGENFADSGYYRAKDENGYRWDEFGIGMEFMEPFFWGWSCGKELNVRYINKEQPKVDLSDYKYEKTHLT